MKIVNILLISLLVLLSFAAGLAKVMQTEQEVAFLQGFGLNSLMIIAFGVVQIVAGVLLIPPKTRQPGAILAALALAVSAILIFVSGNWTFGLISTIPVAMALWVLLFQSSPRDNEEK